MVKLNSDVTLMTTGFFKSFLGVFGVFKAHEPIAAAQVGISIKLDFAVNDVFKSGELVFKVFGGSFLWNIFYEQVLFLELLDVVFEKILAVGECTALLSFELKIAALIFDELELIILVKSDDGSVEGLENIAMDLGLGNIDAGEILDDGGELDR